MIFQKYRSHLFVLFSSFCFKKMSFICCEFPSRKTQSGRQCTSEKRLLTILVSFVLQTLSKLLLSAYLKVPWVPEGFSLKRSCDCGRRKPRSRSWQKFFLSRQNLDLRRTRYEKKRELPKNNPLAPWLKADFMRPWLGMIPFLPHGEFAPGIKLL